MTYSAAIAQSSADSEAARAFVAALTAPDMRDRWLKAGWQPAN
jgi:ABC-type glycerol-3-phosphate transport system substrate-binding protein